MEIDYAMKSIRLFVLKRWMLSLLFLVHPLSAAQQFQVNATSQTPFQVNAVMEVRIAQGIADPQVITEGTQTMEGILHLVPSTVEAQEQSFPYDLQLQLAAFRIQFREGEEVINYDLKEPSHAIELGQLKVLKQRPMRFWVDESKRLRLVQGESPVEINQFPGWEADQVTSLFEELLRPIYFLTGTPLEEGKVIEGRIIKRNGEQRRLLYEVIALTSRELIAKITEFSGESITFEGKGWWNRQNPAVYRFEGTRTEKHPEHAYQMSVHYHVESKLKENPS